MTIVKSILITSFISLLFGFGFKNVLGFAEAFSIAFGLQIVVAFIYSSFRLNSKNDIEESFDAQVNDLLSMSRVTFDCPCNKNKMTEEVFVGVENIFQCDKCNNSVKVDTKIDPILQTTPVDEIQGPTFDELVKTKEDKGTFV